jgi:hypothetical protein
MKLANPVLILILALVILGALTLQLVSSSPQKEALAFVNALQSGNLGRVIGHFDVNICRCIAKGGWGAYLVYKSGQEPNLAFLVGHNYQTGEPRIVPINQRPKSRFGFPWSQPEEAIVNVTLYFDPKQYSPMFLPLPLAYGMNMSQSEFEKFVRYPADSVGGGFTLRLRPGLKVGSIKADLKKVDERLRPRFNFDDAKSEINLSQTAGGSTTTVDTAKADSLLQAALTARPLKYVVPQDAGKVYAKDGSVVPIESLEKQLPKLKSITLSLNLSHGGPLHNWTVFHLAVIEPTFTAGEGNKMIDFAKSRSGKTHYEP